MQLKRSEIIPAVLIAVFILVVIVFGFYPSLRAAPRDQCLANLKQISLALSLYTEDTAGWFPPAERWAEVLLPRHAESAAPFACPEARPSTEELSRYPQDKPAIPVGYALFSPLAGLPGNAVEKPQETPLLFDCDRYGPNTTADLSALAFRHYGRVANVWFFDGHAKSVTETPKLPDPLLKPKERWNEPEPQPPPGAGEALEFGAEHMHEH